MSYATIYIAKELEQQLIDRNHPNDNNSVGEEEDDGNVVLSSSSSSSFSEHNHSSTNQPHEKRDRNHIHFGALVLCLCISVARLNEKVLALISLSGCIYPIFSAAYSFSRYAEISQTQLDAKPSWSFNNAYS
ncbi:hypothetical protein BDB00DRAFT_878778 [Zychaea mexicana]|uniref:uncharacterized protein n=1 Tax=Zychaea mexicana TaxID=64656 RepID=UPI0022FEFFF9|nr:uncharacterized protein BDB00DRAFT_878778 [Zychaea mexicana]KAI9484525.1 hypothetical protein BDB00DRAFT_878778 [Zychaea mexicana]